MTHIMIDIEINNNIQIEIMKILHIIETKNELLTRFCKCIKNIFNNNYERLNNLI